MILRLLQPILERSFIARSYSCQVGKGTTAARDCCRALVNRHRYVLKCDVSRFFPSLDHQVLLEKLAQWVRCPGVLELCRVIIEIHATDPCKTRKAGLPIGNLTSQLWGNFYLDGMDHEITDQAGHGAYLRYTDDFLLFANDKEKLWEFHERIVTHLERVRLQLSLPKSRLLACREGVPFCGFRFLPGQTGQCSVTIALSSTPSSSKCVVMASIPSPTLNGSSKSSCIIRAKKNLRTSCLKVGSNPNESQPSLSRVTLHRCQRSPSLWQKCPAVRMIAYI
jgi:hypothetical protein